MKRKTHKKIEKEFVRLLLRYGLIVAIFFFLLGYIFIITEMQEPLLNINMDDVVPGVDIVAANYYEGEGKINDGMKFNKETLSFLVIEDIDNKFDLDKFTLMAWIRLEELNNTSAIIIGKRERSGVYANRFNVDIRGDVINYNFGIDYPTYLLDVEFHHDFDNGHHCKSTKPIPTDEWVLVATTFDGRQLKLYINGALDNTCSAKFKPIHNNFALMIGSTLDGKLRFIGNLDEVRVWDNALSEGFIKSIYKEEI